MECGDRYEQTLQRLQRITGKAASELRALNRDELHDLRDMYAASYTDCSIAQKEELLCAGWVTDEQAQAAFGSRLPEIQVAAIQGGYKPQDTTALLNAPASACVAAIRAGLFSEEELLSLAQRYDRAKNVIAHGGVTSDIAMQIAREHNFEHDTAEAVLTTDINSEQAWELAQAVYDPQNCETGYAASKTVAAVIRYELLADEQVWQLVQRTKYDGGYGANIIQAAIDVDALDTPQMMQVIQGQINMEPATVLAAEYAIRNGKLDAEQIWSLYELARGKSQNIALLQKAALESGKLDAERVWQIAQDAIRRDTQGFVIDAVIETAMLNDDRIIALCAQTQDGLIEDTLLLNPDTNTARITPQRIAEVLPHVNTRWVRENLQRHIPGILGKL